MRLTVVFLISMIISTQVIADCQLIRSSIGSAVQNISGAVDSIEVVSSEISLISQQKDKLCLEIGRIQSSSALLSDLIIGSMGPVVSLKCIRRDAEVREQILDNVYHLYTYANNLNDDCLNRRSEEEILSKVTDGRTKLVNLLSSLEEQK